MVGWPKIIFFYKGGFVKRKNKIFKNVSNKLYENIIPIPVVATHFVAHFHPLSGPLYRKVNQWLVDRKKHLFHKGGLNETQELQFQKCTKEALQQRHPISCKGQETRKLTAENPYA
jgi:hypothetical protein